MNTPRFLLLILLALLPLAQSYSQDQQPSLDAVVSNAIDPELAEQGWQLLAKKRTPVTVFTAMDAGLQIDVAESNALIYRLPYDAEPAVPAADSTLLLNWQWQVSSMTVAADDRLPAGADPDWPVVVYAAFAVDPQYQSWWRRMMNRVMFGVAGLPASGNVLTYVWRPPESSADLYPNPYIPKTAMLYALPGAPEGKWQSQQRDLFADFEAAFGYPANEVLYLAVSADGEDSGVVSRALLRNLQLTLIPQR